MDTTVIMKHFKNRAVLGVVAAGLLGVACTSQTTYLDDAHNSGELTPGFWRITDATIESDRRFLDSMQSRLQALHVSGVPADDYFLCKSQAWLDMAYNEYTENDRSGVVEAAMRESLRLIEEIERAATDIGKATRIIDSSALVREDLWHAANQIAEQGISACAACTFARLEVQLVWIGHEYRELGWRHAYPAVQAAERMLATVRSEQASCPVQPVPNKPAQTAISAPKVAPATVVIPTGVSVPDTSIPEFVHFSPGRADLDGKSLAIIEQMVAALGYYPKAEVLLIGHTDARGADVNNKALAEKRAAAVATAMAAQGICWERIRVQAVASLWPRSPGASAVDMARNRRVQLVVISDRAVKMQALETDLKVDNPAGSQ